MPKGRRTVEYTGAVPRAGRGKGPKLWAYGYSDLARLLGTTEVALRARVARKTFDPSSLIGIVGAWLGMSPARRLSSNAGSYPAPLRQL